LAIPDLYQRTRALADLARVAAETGNLNRAGTLVGRAEATARAILHPERQAQALAGLARVAAETGDLNRAGTLAGLAEATAGVITNLGRQAQILADIASDAEPSRAWILLAQALTTGHWLASVEILARANPASVICIADEYLSAKNFNKARPG
jgi:hypothetical protein